MILYREGGTGKSRVIQTITNLFRSRGVEQMLVKAAYTGIAASLIDGKTTHTAARLPIKGQSRVSDDARARLQDFWRGRRYLIIDEYSMLCKSIIANISRNVAVGKRGSGSNPSTGGSFGGLNIILCGDLHQFPPVARPACETLYWPLRIADDNAEQLLGRQIYEEFDTVVILNEQMRVTDTVWRRFLVHLRYGNVSEDDLVMLKNLVIRHGKEDMDKWQDTSLVTPRHAVRET